MGLFTKKSAPTPTGDELPALSIDRLKACFDARDWKYFIDSDGDFGAFFDGNRYYFMIKGNAGEVLYGTGDFTQDEFTVENIDKIREFIDFWHGKKTFPRIAYMVNDEGKIRITTEYVVDYEPGVTDEQLVTHVELLVGTSSSFIESLEAHLKGEEA